MSESVANVTPDARKPRNYDRIFSLAIVGLAITIIMLGSWLGYSVYLQNKTDEASSPAMRALGELADVARKFPSDAAIRVRYGEAL
ncbi:MAG: hypothetical protein Q7V14_05545, partial [Coriobacteriia bacterium]|nr:hypothetical protein [Coriobacteriia bacterium]